MIKFYTAIICSKDEKETVVKELKEYYGSSKGAAANAISFISTLHPSLQSQVKFKIWRKDITLGNLAILLNHHNIEL